MKTTPTRGSPLVGTLSNDKGSGATGLVVFNNKGDYVAKYAMVAEGVESQQVWDLLASIGCDVAQGYLVSVPMPMRQLPS